MRSSNGTILILTGEAMWPERINARWPGAQFVARAAFDAEQAVRPAPFQSLAAPAIWGVLIDVGPEPATGVEVDTTTDLGKLVTARLDPGELLAGDPASVVAAARYWELHWRYVGALRDAVATTGIVILDEDPRDDAAIAASEGDEPGTPVVSEPSEVR